MVLTTSRPEHISYKLYFLALLKKNIYCPCLILLSGTHKKALPVFLKFKHEFVFPIKNPTLALCSLTKKTWELTQKATQIVQKLSNIFLNSDLESAY